MLLLAALSLAACKREEAKVVTASRPARVAPPTAKDIQAEQREDIAKDLTFVPQIGIGVNFETPDGENWVKYPSGLLIHELKRTDGTAAQYGQSVSVAYTLTRPGS